MAWLEELFCPKLCVGCRKVGAWICEECFRHLKWAEQKCPMCCQLSLDGAVHSRCRKPWGMEGLSAVWSYRNREMKSAIKAIKYRFCTEMVEELLEKVDLGRLKEGVIVPIPLHPRKLNWRGFNQAEKIGQILAEKSGLALENWLERKKVTKPLAYMKDVEARKAEIIGAFVEMREKREEIKGKRILLVDDVFTSGATMREAAKVLKRAGASEVRGWVLAC